MLHTILTAEEKDALSSLPHPPTITEYVKLICLAQYFTEKPQTDPAKALVICNTAIALDKEVPFGYLVRSAILELLGEISLAIQDISTYLARCKEDSTALKRRANLYLKLKDGMLKQADCKDHSTLPETMHIHALQQADIATVVAILRRDKTLHNRQALYHAKSLLLESNFKKSYADKLKTEDKQECERLHTAISMASQQYIFAQQADQDKQFIQAEFYYCIAFVLCPFDIFSLTALGELAYNQDKLAIAKHFLEQAVNIGNSPKSHYVLGKVHAKLHHPYHARVFFEKALQLSITNRVYLAVPNNKSEILTVLSTLQPDLYQIASTNSASSTTALPDKLPKLFIQGRFTEALALIQACVAQNPWDAKFYEILGNTYKKMGTYHKAVLNYHIALWLKENIKCTDIYDNLTELHFNQGHIQDGVICYRSLKDAIGLTTSPLAVNVEIAALLAGYAKRAASDDQLDLALSLYNVACAFSSNNALYFLGRAMIHRRLRDHTNAEKDYQQAKTLKPNDKQIQIAHERFLESLNSQPVIPILSPKKKKNRHCKQKIPNTPRQIKYNTAQSSIDEGDHSSVLPILIHSTSSPSLSKNDLSSSLYALSEAITPASSNDSSPPETPTSITPTKTRRIRRKTKTLRHANQSSNQEHSASSSDITSLTDAATELNTLGLRSNSLFSNKSSNSLDSEAYEIGSSTETEDEKETDSQTLKESIQLFQFTPLPRESYWLLSLFHRKISAVLYGGAVRDRLMGRDPAKTKDLDILVQNASESALKKTASAEHSELLERKDVSGSYKVFSYTDTTNIDILTKTSDPHSEESALENDFTCNTPRMDAYGNVTFPIKRAYQDIKNKVLITTIPAHLALIRGPILILRAINFMNTLDFTLDESLRLAIHHQVGLLHTLEPTQINFYMRTKFFTKEHIVKSYRRMQELTILETLFPFMQNMPEYNKEWLAKEMEDPIKQGYYPSLARIYVNFLVASNLTENHIRQIVHVSPLLANEIYYRNNLDTDLPAALMRFNAEITNTNAPQTLTASRGLR